MSVTPSIPFDLVWHFLMAWHFLIWFKSIINGIFFRGDDTFQFPVNQHLCDIFMKWHRLMLPAITFLGAIDIFPFLKIDTPWHLLLADTFWCIRFSQNPSNLTFFRGDDSFRFGLNWPGITFPASLEESQWQNIHQRMCSNTNYYCQLFTNLIKCYLCQSWNIMLFSPQQCQNGQFQWKA